MPSFIDNSDFKRITKVTFNKNTKEYECEMENYFPEQMKRENYNERLFSYYVKWMESQGNKMVKFLLSYMHKYIAMKNKMEADIKK